MQIVKPGVVLAASLLCGAPAAVSADVVGGVDLGQLTDYLFVFTDGHEDANWQSSSKGYVGDVAVSGGADFRTSGDFAYAGVIVTDGSTIGAWGDIVENNPDQASAVTGQDALLASLTSQLEQAFAEINSLEVTPGFDNRSAGSLDGLNTQNGLAETFVINVTSDFHISDPIEITGDAGDVYILRWDEDADPTNGYNGQVKFQSGGAIVPLGELTPASFVHVAGDLNASGGGETPAAPYPQGPRFEGGQGELIAGGRDFSGGGFFTGYWLTTGDPDDGQTSPFSNAIFVGGWYSSTSKFSMTSGTSGVHVQPPDSCDLIFRFEGHCPGDFLCIVECATPGGTIAFILADGPGDAQIPPGVPCAGVSLGLDETARLVKTKVADDDGRCVEVVRGVGPGVCGKAVVALDVESCRVSEVVLID
ncbi:MAG: hypothetical protein ACF8PN_12005 [Phycisphaerales bacterium]